MNVALSIFNVTGNGNSFGTIGVNQAGMGSWATVAFDVTLSGDLADGATAYEFLAGNTLIVNPALFAMVGTPFQPIGGLGSGAWILQLPAVPVATHSFAWSGQASQFNGSCSIEIYDATTAQITHSFWMTADTDTFVTGTNIQQSARLLKNSFANPTVLDNSVQSVYNSAKAYSAYVTMTQSGETANAQLNTNYTARFYDRDLADAAYPLTGVTITITRVLDGAVVTEVSPYDAFDIKFEAGHPFGAGSLKFYVTVFKAATNIGNFETGTGVVYSPLVTSGGSAQLADIVYQPVTFNYDTTHLDCEFRIPVGAIQPNAQYYIVMTPAEPTLGLFPYLWEVPVGGLPEPLVLNDCIWIELSNGQTGWIISQFFVAINPEARYRINAVMDKVCYDAALALSNVNGVDFDTDCRSFTLELFDTDGATVLQSWEGLKPSGNNSTFIINQTPNYNDQATARFGWLTRTRWINEQGLLDMTPYPPDTVFEYPVKLTVRFEYLNPDWAAIYTVNSKLNLQSYDNDHGSPSVLSIDFFDNDSGLPVNNLCDVDSLLIVATFDGGNEGKKVSASVDFEPFGAPFNSDGQLSETRNRTETGTAQFQIPSVWGDLQEMQTTVQSDLTARWTLDVSTLPDNARVLIHVNMIE